MKKKTKKVEFDTFAIIATPYSEKLLKEFNDVFWDFHPTSFQDPIPPGLADAQHQLLGSVMVKIRVSVSKNGHKKYTIIE